MGARVYVRPMGFRSAVARALLLFLVVLWVVVAEGARVHPMLVRHVECADHHDIVEVARGRDGRPVAASDLPTLVSADVISHGHGCSLDHAVPAVPTTGCAPVAAPLRPRRLGTGLPARVAPARLAPLAYAPKTSPPPHPTESVHPRA